jgi:hypothetical protein
MCKDKAKVNMINQETLARKLDRRSEAQGLKRPAEADATKTQRLL